jgi:hypothetical protein
MSFRAGAQKVFVLITDNTTHYAGDGSGFTDYTIPEVVNAINAAGGSVFAVSPNLAGKALLTDNDGNPLAAKSLSTDDDVRLIADETGGSWRDIFTADFSDFVDQIVSVVTSTYTLQYTTGNDTVDDGSRTVCVSVFDFDNGDAFDCTTYSPTTCAPDAPHSPGPADEAVNVDPDALLTWETAAAIAIFEDSAPWGNATVGAILEARGMSVTYYTSSDMCVVDLSPFAKVIISSVQGATFVNAVATHAAWFEAYAAAGGVLELHMATQGTAGVTWPGGFELAYSFSDDIRIVETGHPIFNSPNTVADSDLDNWDSSAHGTFSAFPEGAVTLATEETTTPVIMEIAFGSGAIIATTQTIEWDDAPVAAVENLLLYMGETTGPSTLYDVYLDTVNPPVALAAADSAVRHLAVDLDPGTTYYWRVVARNACGDSEGPVWSFTTEGSVATDPVPDVFATATNVPRGTSVQLRISLAANALAGTNADWWIVAQLPNGQLYSFNPNNGLWSTGVRAAARTGLFDVNNYLILSYNGLPVGRTRFYFGVDMTPDSNVTNSTLFLDIEDVTVTPTK